MLRLLVLVAIVALVALIVVKLVKGIRASASKGAGAEGKPLAVEDARLVRCTSCGAFVPRETAVAAAEGYRCGDAGCRERPS